MTKAAAILALVMLGSGCAATAEDAPAASSEEALTSLTALDQVTPDDVARAFAESNVRTLERCAAAHPEITSVTRENLDDFTRISHHESAFDLEETIEALLESAASLRVSEIAGKIEPWAKTQLAGHVDASGHYVAGDDMLLFYYAERDAREAKALSLSSAPGGKPLAEVRKMWRAVQSDRDTLDSAWMNPIKAAGVPTLTEIKKAFHIPYEAQMTTWGRDAVDEFGADDEGPDGARSFAPLATFLKSNAIQKRWLFQAYDSSWSTNVLIVLDDQGQLWGIQMGYSK